MDGVAPDGSPVEIYRALPAEPDLSRLRSVISRGASVLDLGSGPGRLTNPLAVDGHQVVAVDDSALMLAHVVGAETVMADIWTLQIGRRFDVVLALSHLINDAARSRRSALLGVCRRHLAEDGIVIVQRYSPGWLPTTNTGNLGEVAIRLHDVSIHGDGSFAAVATYELGGQMWSQRFTAATVDDDELMSLAIENDLQVCGAIGDEVEWVMLAAARS
jgi:SAM-dependent methyltransferase